MRRLVLLGTCALAAALLGDAAAAVSRPEFIRKGDALCLQVKRELAPIRARAEEAKSYPTEFKWIAAADIWADQIRIQRRFVRRFHALGIPAKDDRARQLSAGLDRGVVLAVRVQRGFANRDTTALARALPAYLRFTTRLNTEVRSYGFRVCGR